MDRIVIAKKDEVNLQILCSEAQSNELSEYFTFKIPGAEYKKGKARYWDGRIRLFNKRAGELCVGLFPYLKQWCEENKYDFICEPQLEETEEFSLIEAKKYVGSLRIPLEAHDYQMASFIRAVRNKRMLLLSPTSSGKSLIQYIIFRYLTEIKGCRKGLLIVPTTHLVEQMYGDFKAYSSVNKFNVEQNVHRIYDYPGVTRHTDKSLTITTWQSMQNMPQEYFAQFDFILGDEAHLFKASSLKFIMSALVNAKYRIGLTGSLDGSKTHQLVLEGLFGQLRKFVTTAELMERKIVAELMIKVLFLRYSRVVSDILIDKTYEEEMEYVLASTSRNRFITNLALSLKGNTLILFQFVEKHGDILYKQLKEKAGSRSVYYIHGGVNTDEREQIRKILETEKDAILIASYGTFQLGVSVKHLHNGILASPGKSRIRVIQSIGRGLRVGELKQNFTLFDVVDDFSVNNQTNTTLDHFQERLKYYNEEKFNYKFYTINIKQEI